MAAAIRWVLAPFHHAGWLVVPFRFWDWPLLNRARLLLGFDTGCTKNQRAALARRIHFPGRMRRVTSACTGRLPPTQPDYYIVAIDTELGPLPWRWELRRRSRPMGVKIGRSGYQSQASAEYAGKRELENFLSALAKEERWRRR